MELPETFLLVTFEAIARHASFRAAADELHLTPSAISHRLKTLERSTGHALITRTTRHVALTPAGEILLPAARTALAALGEACERLSEPTGAIVTITTTDSVATCWLIDRLPSVTSRVEDLEVRVLTVAAGARFDPAVADLAIAYGQPGEWPGGNPILVASEAITPVCSPPMAAEISSVDDLWSFPLLEDTNLFFDWATFAEAVGIPTDPNDAGRRSVVYNHSHLALRAAARGQGIALAGSPLCDDAIARGELVAPLPGCTLTTPNDYYLVTSAQRRSPAAEQVRDALVHTLRVE